MRTVHRRLPTAKLATATYAAALLALSAASAGAQSTPQQTLKPALPSFAQYFGYSVAAGDDVMVVGAPHRPHPTLGFLTTGGADVFRRDPASGAWGVEASLLDGDYHDAEGFGYAVAVDGDRLVVGAPSHDVATQPRAGAAYVFRYDSATYTWNEEQKLEGSVPQLDGYFGGSVAISGDAIVVGVVGYAGTGAAFVFRYQAASSSWVEEALLIDPDGTVGDRAGEDVAIDGATIAVGSPIETASAHQSGSVGVWTLSGTTWTQTQELTPNVAATTMSFGRSLALRGNQLIVGSPTESDATTGNIGGAWLFERSGATFALNQRFQPPATTYNLQFGHDVAVNGNTVVIGQPFDWMNPTISGSAWLFRRRNSHKPWVQDQLLIRANGGFDDELGASVAMSDSAIVLGARFANQFGQDEGAVAIYDFAELSLSISPRYPAPDATIDLEAHRGTPGDLILITIEELDGAPVYVPLLTDFFQANYAYAVQDSAPNPALGVSTGLRAYKISPTGKLVASNLAYVDL